MIYHAKGGCAICNLMLDFWNFLNKFTTQTPGTQNTDSSSYTASTNSPDPELICTATQIRAANTPAFPGAARQTHQSCRPLPSSRLVSAGNRIPISIDHFIPVIIFIIYRISLSRLLLNLRIIIYGIFYFARQIFNIA